MPMPEAGKQIAEAGEPQVRVAPSFGFDPLMARDRVLGVSKEDSRDRGRKRREERGTDDSSAGSIVIDVSKGWNTCAS
jgi:hypothetical protein